MNEGNLAKKENGISVKHYVDYDANENKGFCILHKLYNDKMPIEECLNIFKTSKENGKFINDNFEDDVWEIYYFIIDRTIKIDFHMLAPQDIILKLKKYVLVKIGLQNCEVKGTQRTINALKEVLINTHYLEEEYIEDFRRECLRNNISVSGYRDFFSFVTLPNADKYYKSIVDIKIDKDMIRDIPDYQSIFLYDAMIKNFIEYGRLDLKLKYYPVLIWWMVSTIIPMRPSEVLVLKRNCIYVNGEKYYMHIDRIKKKYQKEHYNMPIMKEFQIPESVYLIISDYIDYVKEIDDGPYLIPNSLYQKPGTRDKDRINLEQFRRILNNFLEEIVQDTYGYEIVAIGEVTNENQIERIKPGDTRHLAFMNMLMQGLNPLYIQRVGGHYTVEEQLHYCSHIDKFTTTKTYVLAKALQDKDNLYSQNLQKDWALLDTEKEAMGLSFYDLPKVKGGLGRCTSKNVPIDCVCEECLFCSHFIPEKKVSDIYIDEMKERNLQNITIKQQLLQKMIKNEIQDERELEKISLQISTLVNQKLIIDSYIMNRQKKGEVEFEE